MEILRMLIIKAGRRYHQDIEDTRYGSLVAKTRLNAFGQVAADILRACQTATSFEMAIREALVEVPLVINYGLRADRAAEDRQKWNDRFVEAVMKRLI